MTSSITPSHGAPHARIVSVGAYRPSRVVPNSEIVDRIDSSDEWIRDRSGIIERRWAGPDESVVDLAVAAGREALAKSGIAADRIGLVMVATVTHPFQTPSAAAEVAFQLGASRAGAIDLGAACAGFCYGLAMANDLIRGGSAQYVLLVGVEKLSDWINPEDRGTAFLFADAAGAVVVGPSDLPA
ncbi:MAG: thiolase family protein, partial [Candidatus Nanopelagicales bacterium]